MKTGDIVRQEGSGWIAGKRGWPVKVPPREAVSDDPLNLLQLHVFWRFWFDDALDKVGGLTELFDRFIKFLHG